MSTPVNRGEEGRGKEARPRCPDLTRSSSTLRPEAARPQLGAHVVAQVTLRPGGFELQRPSVTQMVPPGQSAHDPTHVRKQASPLQHGVSKRQGLPSGMHIGVGVVVVVGVVVEVEVVLVEVEVVLLVVVVVVVPQ